MDPVSFGNCFMVFGGFFEKGSSNQPWSPETDIG